MMIAVAWAIAILTGLALGGWIGFELGRWWAEQRWWQEQNAWQEEPGLLEQVIDFQQRARR